jgi:hypothetical protein
MQINQATVDFYGLFRKPNLTPTATHISTTYRKEKRKILVYKEREEKDGMARR